MKRTISIKGIVALVVGIILGMAYISKFFPFDPVRNIALLTVWSYTGWGFAALSILYGLCEIFVRDDL